MEEEFFLSGYCRCQDQSRRVLLELFGENEYEADCLFGSCPHEAECQIAQQIREKLNAPR